MWVETMRKICEKFKTCKTVDDVLDVSMTVKEFFSIPKNSRTEISSLLWFLQNEGGAKNNTIAHVNEKIVEVLSVISKQIDKEVNATEKSFEAVRKTLVEEPKKESAPVAEVVEFSKEEKKRGRPAKEEVKETKKEEPKEEVKKEPKKETKKEEPKKEAPKEDALDDWANLDFGDDGEATTDSDESDSADGDIPVDWDDWDADVPGK